jgi:hypothetical protein
MPKYLCKKSIKSDIIAFNYIALESESSENGSLTHERPL